MCLSPWGVWQRDPSPPLPHLQGQELLTQEAEGNLCIRSPTPGMARTIRGDHDRFVETYFRPFPGFYFSGDGARRDIDGHYQITGRVDDVINVKGHRVGTAEIESAMVGAESGVGAIHDNLLLPFLPSSPPPSSPSSPPPSSPSSPPPSSPSSPPPSPSSSPSLVPFLPSSFVPSPLRYGCRMTTGGWLRRLWWAILMSCLGKVRNSAVVQLEAPASQPLPSTSPACLLI